jgi:hypothetical protein
MSSALNDTAYLPDGSASPSPTRTPVRQRGEMLPEIGEKSSPSRVVLTKIDMSPSKVSDSIKLPDIPEDQLGRSLQSQNNGEYNSNNMHNKFSNVQNNNFTKNQRGIEGFEMGAL